MLPRQLLRHSKSPMASTRTNDGAQLATPIFTVITATQLCFENSAVITVKNNQRYFLPSCYFRALKLTSPKELHRH